LPMSINDCHAHQKTSPAPLHTGCTREINRVKVRPEKGAWSGSRPTSETMRQVTEIRWTERGNWTAGGSGLGHRYRTADGGGALGGGATAGWFRGWRLRCPVPGGGDVIDRVDRIRVGGAANARGRPRRWHEDSLRPWRRRSRATPSPVSPRLLLTDRQRI
jgi:hypothetical protein